MTTLNQVASLQREILQSKGLQLTSKTKALDVGCGNGNLVQAWLDAGCDAHGCDFRFKPGPLVERLVGEGRLRLVEPTRYVLPYPDASFDVLVSNQVMEHVKDYSTTLAEMRRILKPGGVCLHMFPSRWRLLEPHVFVPMATVLQGKTWLSIWALAGVRLPRQKGMRWIDVVQENHAYLKNSTNYLSGRTILEHFRQHFSEVYFEEELFLRHSPNPRGRFLHSLGRYLPFMLDLYRTAWSRTILAR